MIILHCSPLWNYTYKNGNTSLSLHKKYPRVDSISSMEFFQKTIQSVHLPFFSSHFSANLCNLTFSSYTKISYHLTLYLMLIHNIHDSTLECAYFVLICLLFCFYFLIELIDRRLGFLLLLQLESLWCPAFSVRSWGWNALRVRSAVSHTLSIIYFL